MSLFSTAGLARASARRPWTVLLTWLFIIVASGVISARFLSGALTTDTEFLNEPESVKGFDLMDERLGLDDPLAETVIVTSTSSTVDDPAFRQVVQDVTTDLRTLEVVNADPTRTFNYYEAMSAPLPGAQAAAEALVSEDRRSTIIPVTLTGSMEDVIDGTDSFLDTLSGHATDAVHVTSVGDLSINEEFNTIAEEDLARAELFGIPIALLILVVVFGALVAAGVPILLALTSIGVALGLTAVIGQIWELSFFITNMITMIGLAVGIDYALFIVERYREERRHGREKLAAIEVAGATASKAVLFSGMAVALALLGLFLIPTSIFRSLGLGAILVVVVAVLAMLTLIPAMLSLLGDRIDWPRRRRGRRKSEGGTPTAPITDHSSPITQTGFWARVTRVVMGHPVISVVLSVVILGTAALPYFDMNTGFAGVETLPEGEAKDAYLVLERDFSAGRLAPVDVVIDARPGTEVEAGIARLNEALAANPIYGEVAAARWSENDDLALVELTLSTNPNDQTAYDAVERLREEIVPRAFAGVPAEVYVTGDTAFNADFFELVSDWTPIVFALVLGLSFILLMLAFRSIVVPAKAIAMNLLSVGAAYGLMVLVFQKGYGADLLGFQETPTIEAWIPIFLFCVLFGLSMDYHVFLLSRIREHYDLTGRNRESVAAGLQVTGKIITGAALIMVVVFVGFSLGRLVMLQQVGFGLAVAVLLDATVVRSVLVPAAMALLGNVNWYLPSWLRWIPDLRVESAPPAPVAEPAGD
ncbi:MAG: MMPL family transporter [Thermomicrobiales bacterium]